ncbi:MAG: hypothetical protein ACRCXC_00645 [Legionella sp.]
MGLDRWSCIFKIGVPLLLFAANVHAHARNSASLTWVFSAGIGYTDYMQTYQNDGQTAFARLSIGKTLYAPHQWLFGLEEGVQSGNTMRLHISDETMELLGGLPIPSTIKPMVDLLATIKSPLLHELTFFFQAKGGLTFRHWQFISTNSIPDKY